MTTCAREATSSDTVGRKCVCNGLLGTIGLGQQRGDTVEPAILTAGAGLADVAALLDGRASYPPRTW